MSASHKPIVGLIFLIGLALLTGGAAFYTVFLPPPSHCPSTPVEYTINATAHQWGFIFNATVINGTLVNGPVDVTKNGWTICHNSIVHFMVHGVWEHNPDISATANFSQHGFFIAGLMTSPPTITAQTIEVTVNFATAGTYVLRCTIPCSPAGYTSQWGSHESMAATITVI